MGNGRLRGILLSNPVQSERATNLDVYHITCHYLYKMLYAASYYFYITLGLVASIISSMSLSVSRQRSLTC